MNLFSSLLLVLLIIGMPLAFVLGGGRGIDAERKWMEDEAIQHHAAHYNATTGAFEWNQ